MEGVMALTLIHGGQSYIDCGFGGGEMSCEAAKTTDGELKTNLCSGTLHYKNGATFPGSALHQSLAP
jgi:hypothetical protein